MKQLILTLTEKGAEIDSGDLNPIEALGLIEWAKMAIVNAGVAVAGKMPKDDEVKP